MKLDSFTVDLQFHPYPKRNYELADILKEMERKNLSGLGLLYYEWEKETSLTIIKEINRKRMKENYRIENKKNVFLFVNKDSGKIFSLILGQELGPQNQKWHILAIGVTGIKSSTPEGVIEEVLEKEEIAILDHPFADPRRRFRDISPEKESELINLCLKYKGKIALEWNGYSLPKIRKLLPGYGNTNLKTEKLAEKLNLPLVPTTDLHCKSKRLLKEIGTAFIEIPVKDMDYGKLLTSLKKNILSQNFKTHRDYVPLRHFLEAYGSVLWKKSAKG